MHVKVTEIVGESPDSWKNAVESAINEASKTLPNISCVEIVNFTANVKNGKLTEYKADCKLCYTD
ncbi:dodecin family protein [Desulfolucanica intricata]|uniref:dodecin family protein n=1 Tax=Desulfolucanica intricata TaxID=1285191 RepID=UPI00082C3F50|nr:dodecin family protein [Desulfolucanica intricata]